jgi:hypothetical protein
LISNETQELRIDSDTHETPTGAAESCPLELAGGDDGTVKVRSAAATPHINSEEMKTE